MSVERLGLIVVGMLVLLVLVLVVSAAMACGWPCHYVANDLKWDRVPWLLIGPLWPFVQIPQFTPLPTAPEARRGKPRAFAAVFLRVADTARG
jgi:hypothetical protein